MYTCIFLTVSLKHYVLDCRNQEEASDLLLPAATLDLSRLESLPSVMDYRCIVSGPQSSCLLISQGVSTSTEWDALKSMTQSSGGHAFCRFLRQF